MSITILLADDHPILRHGIRSLLEREKDIKIVGEASDGIEAVQKTEELKPHIVIMDVGMPKLSGLEAIKQIKANNPDQSIIVLSIHDDEQYIIGLLETGVQGYLLKTSYGEELVQAVRAVNQGCIVLHHEVGKKLISLAAGHSPKKVGPEGIEHLTRRELHILELAAKGMSNAAIASKLQIGVRTVKGHLLSVYSKMRVHSRTEAIWQARQKGYIDV
jgi:DNA-binding NarL/FixJ family response regulator